MDFLNIDPLLLVVICSLLCLVGGALSVVLSLVSGMLDMVFGILGMFGDFLAGGPASWCGCFVFIFGCALCTGIGISFLSILSTCGTPEAVNFCRLFW